LFSSGGQGTEEKIQKKKGKAEEEEYKNNSQNSVSYWS
jgi:hypothetical protein